MATSTLTPPVRATSTTATTSRERGIPTDRARARRLLSTAAKATLGVAISGVLIVWALPRAVGAEWTDIGAAVGSVEPWQLLALAGLWMLGLVVHTLALSAAMPGLSHRRSLLLNLTGSFVSNLLPLGGAAGTVANYSMARKWGFGRVEFARWALVTNIWDTLIKLALPALAVAWLAATATGGESLTAMALWSVGALAVLGVGVGALFRSDRVARGLGRTAGRVALRLRRPVDPSDWAARAVEMRCDTSELVSRGWLHLTVGKLAYAALQAGLLWACLDVVGLTVNPEIVFAAFAMQSVLTLFVITPGATGFVEVGMAGVLVAMGVPAAGAAAGILLYRGFVFLMEIPVGGAAMGWWAMRQRGAAVA